MAKVEARPNIVLIMTDQQRWDTIAAHVNRFAARTPAMDTMVRNGVVFSHAFATNPVCTPARATIVTGRMPSEVGMPGNIGNPNPPINQSVLTIGHRMERAGYSTVYHGKSHLGTPLEQLGFKTRFENSHDPTTVAEAVRYWRNRDWVVQKRPFFHIVSLLDPHDIYYLDPDEERPVTLEPWPNRHDDRSTKPWPQRDYKRGQGWSDERWEYYRQFYASRVERADMHLGMLLEELIMGGFGSNTWVIFTADHGDMAGEHGVGFKGPFLYDCQVRIPLVIMPPRRGYPGPGAVPAPRGFQPRISSVMASQLDIVPTILDLAGVEPEPTLRGRSLVPAVCGDDSGGHEAVFAEMTMFGNRVSPARMVRTKKWKYTFYLGHGEELYDLEADPWEITNLAGRPKHAKVQAELKARMLEFVRDTDDPIFAQQPTDGSGKPFTTVPIEMPYGLGGPRIPGSRMTWQP